MTCRMRPSSPDAEEHSSTLCASSTGGAVCVSSVSSLGIDTVHFGVVAVVNIMIGLLTPPFGLLLFIVANMTRQPLVAIVREAAPFIVAAIAMLALITFIPDTVLWLPRVMGYKG